MCWPRFKGFRPPSARGDVPPLLCALAGVVAGRLARGAVAANTSLDSPNTDSGFATPALTDPAYPSRPQYASTLSDQLPARRGPSTLQGYDAAAAMSIDDLPSTYERRQAGLW